VTETIDRQGPLAAGPCGTYSRTHHTCPCRRLAANGGRDWQLMARRRRGTKHARRSAPRRTTSTSHAVQLASVIHASTGAHGAVPCILCKIYWSSFLLLFVTSTGERSHPTDYRYDDKSAARAGPSRGNRTRKPSVWTFSAQSGPRLRG
jgi:hypothetical protein